ncbi:MAG: polysaccharide biosynthesis/export family protein [Pseudomonadota bacterium]
MQPLKFLIGLAVGLVLTITGSAAMAEELDGPYLLEPGDVIDISVLEDPELNRQALVRPDGKVSMPIAGTLDAAGRSPEQLMRVIRARLAGNFIEPPNVTVALVSLADPDEQDDEDETSTVYILGEVNRPGRYDYQTEEPINILQALTLAGGPGVFAARQRIQVREIVDQTDTLRLFDYDAAEDGVLVTNQDLGTLADGAIIIVPERGLFE